MKKINLLIMLMIASLLMGLSACKNDNNDDDTEQDWITIMENMDIANDFNYQLTKKVSLAIKLPFTVDYSGYRGTVYIMTGPVTLGGHVLDVGAVDQSGVYQKQINIPSYLTQLFIQTHAGNATVALSAAASYKVIFEDGVDFGNDYDTIPPQDTTAGMTYKSEFSGTEYAGLKFTEDIHVSNLIQNGDFSVNDFGNIQNWSSAMVVDGKWYITQQLNGFAGQYNDNGEWVLRISKSPYCYGGVAQLINASQGDLITFTADYKTSGAGYKKAWLYLIPRNAGGNPIAYFSRNIYGNKPNWDSYTVAATMPANTSTVQVLLWQHIFGGYMYWDNVVVTGPVVDSDGDGVDDEDDAYPNDPARAYNIYYPDFNSFGSLAYEDNWPGKGDYDFNDLVVDYQFKQVTNASNNLVDLYGKFVIRAIGASFTNGFGFGMGMAPSFISNVSGVSVVDSYITLLSNNTEAGQDKATIIVTDNAFTQLPHPGGGTGVNTTPGQTYVEPDTMEVTITMAQPVPLSSAGNPPYNPFIIVDQIRGREVHLPDEPPTSLANHALFGTEQDDSNPATGKYYKTVNNLPWAIDVPAEFDYPTEKSVIIQAYLHFVAWAESSGSDYSDWYLNQTGYRNSNYIYQVP